MSAPLARQAQAMGQHCKRVLPRRAATFIHEYNISHAMFLHGRLLEAWLTERWLPELRLTEAWLREVLLTDVWLTEVYPPFSCGYIEPVGQH